MLLQVIDDFLEDPHAERKKGISSEYRDHTHNGLKYRGISLCDDPSSIEKIEKKTGATFKESTVFYRRYLETEENETYIHNDALIGTITGILYLNLPEQCHGGTAFWKHRRFGWAHHPVTHRELDSTGFCDTKEFWEDLLKQGFDESKWEMIDYCEMRFNRLLLFWSPRYHSRYPMKAFGRELSDARLIKCFFCRA
jgi:hypothetical protein